VEYTTYRQSNGQMKKNKMTNNDVEYTTDRQSNGQMKKEQNDKQWCGIHYGRAFGFIALKTLKYLSFHSFDVESTWWGLFQKPVVRIKFDIYFIGANSGAPEGRTVPPFTSDSCRVTLVTNPVMSHAWGNVASTFSITSVFHIIVCHFVLFHLAIWLSVRSVFHIIVYHFVLFSFGHLIVCP
jgi:hypothetical protein